jgi:outer membrane autotransporter protein
MTRVHKDMIRAHRVKSSGRSGSLSSLIVKVGIGVAVLSAVDITEVDAQVTATGFCQTDGTSADVFAPIGEAFNSAERESIRCTVTDQGAGQEITSNTGIQSRFKTDADFTSADVKNEGNNIDLFIGPGVVFSSNLATVGLGSGVTVVNSGILETRGGNNAYGISLGRNGRLQEGGNSITNTTEGIIRTTGTNGTAVFVDADLASAGGNQILNEGTVQTTGSNADGIRLFTGGETAVNRIGNTGSITTAADDVAGIRLRALRSSTDRIENSGSITSSGAAAMGIAVTNNDNRATNAVTVIQSGTISALGDGGMGINVAGAANVSQMSGGAIDADRYGIRIDDGGTGRASVVSNQGTIRISGTSATGSNRGAGIFAIGDGHRLSNLTTGSITTTGSFNDGMAVQGNRSVLTNAGTITTAGPTAYGISTLEGSSDNAVFNSGTVRTTGSRARGVSIFGSDTEVINTGLLETQGRSSTAVYLQGDRLRMDNSGTIRATGGALSGAPPSEGIFVNSVARSFTTTIINRPGAAIISEQGPAIRTLNGTVNIDNAGLIRGGNGVALQGGTGDINLTLRTGSRIVGTADGGGGSNQTTLLGTGRIDNRFTRFQTLTMDGSDWTWAGVGDFRNSALNSGVFRLQSDFTGNVNIAPGAVLDAAGGFRPVIRPAPGQGVITLRNAGTIDLTGGGLAALPRVETPSLQAQLASSGPFDRLRIEGNYEGQGGLLALQTVLASDNAPTDQLIVDGDTSGATDLVIFNAGGTGDATTGDGIKVVHVGGVSGGTFQLINGDYEVNGQPVLVAGAYGYTLWQDGSWYLRSELRDPSAPVEPEDPEIPVVRPPTLTLFQAGVPVYEAYPVALLQMASLPTFRQRTSERYLDGEACEPTATRAPSPTPAAQGAREDVPVCTGMDRGPVGWVRISGDQGRLTPSVSSSRNSLRTQSTRFHAGVDVPIGVRESGQWVAGIGFQAVDSTVDVESHSGDGRIDSSGEGLEASLTWLGEEGLYVDAQAQYLWINGDLTSKLLNVVLDENNKARAHALSLEVGKQYELNPGWNVTPFTQVVYRQTRFDGFRDLFGSDVSLSRARSLRAPTGVHFSHVSGNEGARTHLFGSAYLDYEFMDGNIVEVAGTDIVSRDERLWMGVSAGAARTWNKGRQALVAEIGARFAPRDRDGNYGFTGNLMFEHRF